MKPSVSKLRYNWKRFWCERGGTFSLSDNGYLTNPDSEYGSMLNPGLISTEALHESGCAILLGEPGIGKSHCIEEMWQDKKASSEGDSQQFLRFDLRGYGSEDRVIRDIFAGTSVQSWIAGTGHLHLFLDSLDEGLLRINTLATILSEQLVNLPIGRLRLRIACRTADWPSTLETRLVEVWGEDLVKVYELTPLRRLDVEEGLKANNIEDTARFFEEVDLLHAVPLAIKPITLKFLLNIYTRDGSFPSNQIDLYLEGCRILCEEPSDWRRDAKLMGLLSADQRLAVAMRIAAITVFANRYAIWMGLDVGNVPDVDVAIRQVVGGTETSSSGTVAVTEQMIRETLGTGLFSSRGPDRMGWAHQTYAEFLAARYLVEHTFSIDQVDGLIMHSGDPDGRLVPQLSQTGAWIGRMVPQIFEQIVKSDPDVFLLSDVSVGAPADREELTKALLALAQEEKLPVYRPGIRLHLRKLNTPNLPEQLRPYICDTSRGRLARRMAIDIAEACQVNALSKDLATVALDKSQFLDIRVNAAWAVAGSGTDSAKEMLLPLAIEKLDDDPQDELKGCALRATWPNFLSRDDLFSNLTVAKDRSLFGAYWSFLERELPEQLRLSDLPRALEWVRSQNHSREAFDALLIGIVLLAWDNLEAPGIAEMLATAILSRLRPFHELFSYELSYRKKRLLPFFQELVTNTKKRQLLLLAFVPQLRDPKLDPLLLIFRRPAFVQREDLPWLLNSLSASPDLTTKRVLAEIIQRITDWQDRTQFDEVMRACQTEPILADVLGWLINPIELNSPAAERMKANFLVEKEFERQRLEKPLVDPPPAERIRLHLEGIEGGNLAAWPLLCLDLTLTPTSAHYETPFSPKLRTLPGWETSDVDTRSRILEAARKYIASHTPNKSEWIGKDVFHWRDFSGCKAFHLLFEESPDSLSKLDPGMWAKWASVIVACPAYEESDEEVLSEILKFAYPHASDEVHSTLGQLIDHEILGNKHVFINKRILKSWNSPIAQTLLGKAKTSGLNATSLGSLLDVLLSQGMQEAISFAKSLVSMRALSSPQTRERAVAAAVVLLRWAEDAGWSVIWPLIKQDTGFGREALEALSFVPDKKSGFLDRIDEESLGELYLWLVQLYGSDETGSGFMGPSHSVFMLQQSVLNVLKARGSAKAVEVLASLVKELPQLKWLKFYHLEAQNITRQQTWIPSAPAHILSLAANSQSRIIQSGGHLLKVVIESLERLQAKLHAEVPAVEFLWIPVGEKTFKPRDEDSISNYIKIHLDEDLNRRGVVVNREVQIHLGQRTDIHVDAAIRTNDGGLLDIISAIVEVKGSWNEELNHAMKTQLVEKYLKDNQCQYGLYLVGWFKSQNWDDADRRKAKTPKRTIAEARVQFDRQASELSNGLTHVKALVLDATLH